MTSAKLRMGLLTEVQQLADKRRRDFINNLLDLDLAKMREQVAICLAVLEESDSDEERENAKRILDFVNALGRFRFPLRWED